MVKNVKYTVPLPQMRMHPPVMISPQQDVETEENFQVFEYVSGHDSNPRKRVLTPLLINVSEITPKEQRARNKPKERIVINNITDEKDFVGLLENTTHDLCWKPHEEEVAFFWGQSKDKVPYSGASREEKTLLDLLKEDTKEQQLNEKSMNKIANDSAATPAQHSKVIKHRMNCPNENEAFVSLRQIYPNKQPSGLWDLFVKCNGDVDWAVDILLKEDELSIGNDDFFSVASIVENEDALTCCCDGIEESTFKLSSPQSITDAFSLLTTSDSKRQRQRNRIPRQSQRWNNAQPRQNQRTNNALNNVKETLEGIFVLGPEYYSEHVRKIRDTRNSVGEFSSTTTVYADAATQTDILDEEEPEHDDDGDLLELTLGDSLVKQLNGIFKFDTPTLREDLSIKESPLKVFMPRTLAKEVYMLCMESAYNQIEENRQHLLHEDEDFARLLKIPKYENCQQSPRNMRELLDMELAWMIYNNDKEQELRQKQADKVPQPTDLAAHLTHLKLCETFPDIPPETLLDILAAHGNRFGETVEVLRSSITENDEAAVLTEENLLHRAMCENEVLKQQIDIETSPEHQQQQQRHDEGYAKSPVQPDEAKRVALRNFEETRNLAAHHCQLKAECYQKAKEAIQKGNNAVAVYYSQIANLHKKKIDMYNHRAANCIVAVHKYTQNNPDLLDLHYLHALEAIGCLDLFLDRHITVLRSVSRSYKHVFIITGRGLHSAGGVSTIKNKVKSRLKERNLRWSEVNPGLLKVKIFSASRHSKNII